MYLQFQHRATDIFNKKKNYMYIVIEIGVKKQD